MSRKKAAIIAIILVAAVALAPLALFGPFVSVATVDLALTVSSAPATKQNLQVVQPFSFDVSLDHATVNVGTMTAYHYLATRLTGTIHTAEDGNPAGAIVQITITLNLTTPTNHSLVFTLNPVTGHGVGSKRVQIMLGPEEGLREHGEFHLTITIHVMVTPPGFSEPVVDLTLEPVNRTFTVP